MHMEARIMFIQSFRHALEGIKHTFQSERNFKIHTLCFTFAILCGFFFQISATKWCILLIVSGQVFAAETFNTCIEKIMDFIHPEKDIRIKYIKDMSAGAVLISACVAMIVGIILFLPPILSWLSLYVRFM